ncbi:MAG: hypothetical protein E6J20_17695 [Chloroflexi bacterium]|nr:MAG: hypothetical protein E6J20_17695 [Chloroflexota bacterium]
MKVSYDNYQSVRNALMAALTVLLVGAVVAFVYGVLSPAHRDALLSFAASWPAVLVSFGLVPAAGLIAFILVEFLEIHDRYDSYVTGWRGTFDVDVILARLYAPFAAEYPTRFMREASRHRGTFMERLFYAFAGDRDGSIRKNLQVRFWERALVYWLTQLIELVLLVLLIALTGYRLAYPPQTVDDDRYPFWVTAILLLLAINRLLVRAARGAVRVATIDEVDSIVTDHLADLRSRFEQLAGEYGIARRANPL